MVEIENVDYVVKWFGALAICVVTIVCSCILGEWLRVKKEYEKKD